jgi:tetratricopeptide (TPR) repeat protein
MFAALAVWVWIGALVLPPRAHAQDTTAQTARATRAAEICAMGDAFARAGDWASAAGYYRDAIAVDAGFAGAYVGLARTYRARGSLEYAREALEAGLRRHRDHPALAVELSETLEARGDRRAALAVVERAARGSSESAAVLIRVARLAQALGRFARALAAYRAIIHVTDDPALRAEAEAHVPALELLVAETDPVTSPSSPSAIRDALRGR